MKTTLINLILLSKDPGEEEESDETDDETEDDETDDETEDEETDDEETDEEYTEIELKKKRVPELKKIAKGLNIVRSYKMKKSTLIESIISVQ